MTRLLARREFALALVVTCLVLAIGARAPSFLTRDSAVAVLADTSMLAMLALAQMAVLLTRGIDLSVAANLALTGMLTALLGQAHPDLPVPVLMAVAIAAGLVLGLVNGGLIASLGIPPIVVTLGTMAVYRGMIFVIAGGRWVNSHEMSPSFLSFPRGSLLGLPSLVWTAGLVSTGMWLFLARTGTGRGLYAVGGNPVAALYCGIDRVRTELLVYGLAGAVSGLCGYLWVSRYGIAYSDIALGYELTVIAACVIGGVSIGGGIGSVGGALLGALFLGVVANALPLIGVSPFWQMAIAGAVILCAVALNARSEQPVPRLILPEARRAAASRGPA